MTGDHIIGDFANIIAGDGVKFSDARVHLNPLIFASMHGYQEHVEHMLRLGANVNAETAQGKTALRAAAQCGRKEVVELLIARDADANILADDQVIPRQFPMVVEALAKYGMISRP